MCMEEIICVVMFYLVLNLAQVTYNKLKYMSFIKAMWTLFRVFVNPLSFFKSTGYGQRDFIKIRP